MPEEEDARYFSLPETNKTKFWMFSVLKEVKKHGIYPKLSKKIFLVKEKFGAKIKDTRRFSLIKRKSYLV